MGESAPSMGNELTREGAVEGIAHRRRGLARSTRTLETARTADVYAETRLPIIPRRPAKAEGRRLHTP